jgi:hypothetical protein
MVIAMIKFKAGDKVILARTQVPKNPAYYNNKPGPESPHGLGNLRPDEIKNAKGKILEVHSVNHCGTWTLMLLKDMEGNQVGTSWADWPFEPL